MATPAHPAIIPSQSTTNDLTYRTLKFQLGDGYIDAAPDGANYKLQTYNVVFENLNATNAATMTTFYDTIGSWTQFSWTPPNTSTSYNWYLDVAKVSITPKAGNIVSITATYTRAF